MFLPVILIIFIVFHVNRNREVTVKELQDHIKYLSSDSLKGRLTGSAGDSLAAEYIRNELASFGFVPLSGDGFQRFKVTSRLVPGDENSLSIDGQNFISGKRFYAICIQFKFRT